MVSLHNAASLSRKDCVKILTSFYRR
jgi:hypothetical protein